MAGNRTILKKLSSSSSLSENSGESRMESNNFVVVYLSLPHKAVAHLRGLILSKPCRKPLLAHIISALSMGDDR
jgi:hypothetical protein